MAPSSAIKNSVSFVSILSIDVGVLVWISLDDMELVGCSTGNLQALDEFSNRAGTKTVPL